MKVYLRNGNEKLRNKDDSVDSGAGLVIGELAIGLLCNADPPSAEITNRLIQENVCTTAFKWKTKSWAPDTR
jgi:hypothetical protein